MNFQVSEKEDSIIIISVFSTVTSRRPCAPLFPVNVPWLEEIL